MTKWEQFIGVYNDIDSYPALSDVAEKLGLSVSTVKNKAGVLRRTAEAPELVSRRREAEKGRLGFKPVLPGFVVKQVSSRDDEGSWVKQVKEPGPLFVMPEGQKLKGVSAFVDGEGREIGKWIKTQADTVTSDLIASLHETFKAYKGIAPLVPAPQLTIGDLLTVYPIADLHLGMLSDKSETGEDYNLEIACERACSMVSQLVAQSQPSRQAIILGLGDLFHNNDHKNMTPRSGHILDVAARWPRILATGVRLMMDLVELALQKHEEVIVRILPGNHDEDAAIALTVALSVAYHNNPRVIVDDNPSLIFYHRFGKVLLGATHGHTMKPDRMAMMMATDCAVDWGMTVFKHFFFGHIHHETMKEIGPVRVESFNTIAAKDAHAHGGGYRSGQSLTALTFHAERGEIGRHRVNLS